MRCRIKHNPRPDVQASPPESAMSVTNYKRQMTKRKELSLLCFGFCFLCLFGFLFAGLTTACLAHCTILSQSNLINKYNRYNFNIYRRERTRKFKLFSTDASRIHSDTISGLIYNRINRCISATNKWNYAILEAYVEFS